ncbi:MAG: DUF934 domain-containing protein [Proteobacteria bacterium]|nr:DUF934 domain-containing protein [Pseudomonadota bacterium]
MALIIRQRKIVARPEDERLVPLAQWNGEPGVLLGTADDPAALKGRLDRLSVIAIEFPQFTDGRGYTIARLLRERYGYKGELRAVGEVLRDNLFYLSRCGFDSFLVSDQSRLDDALEGLGDFSDGYQASADRPQPLFRRRAA